MNDRPASGRRPLLLIAAAIVVVAAIAVVLLVVSAKPGRPVEQIELVDLTAPAMVLELARGLGHAVVVELPDRHPTERHDLRLTDTTDVLVMEEIELLDERFRAEARPGVLLYWPTATLVSDNPYETRVESFSGSGGAAEVVRDLVLAAGLGNRLAIQSDVAGRSRPVTLEVRDVALRDALAEIALQAHLAMRNDPRMIRFSAAATQR